MTAASLTPFTLNNRYPLPQQVDVDTLASLGRDSCGNITTHCTTYADTGNAHILTVTSPGVRDVYVYPNNKFSIGRQLLDDGSYGKIVSRDFIF